VEKQVGMSMKLPRKSKQWLREIEKASDRVYEKLEGAEQISKAEFESILYIVIDEIARNRRMDGAQIAAKNREVVQALTTYLQHLPESQRDWQGIVTFMYMKFHQALGLMNEQQMLKILMLQ
jgi:hypothetical protein